MSYYFVRANDTYDIPDGLTPVVFVGFNLKQTIPFQLNYTTNNLPNIGDHIIFSGRENTGEGASGLNVTNIKRYYDLKLQKDQIIVEVRPTKKVRRK